MNNKILYYNVVYTAPGVVYIKKKIIILIHFIRIEDSILRYLHGINQLLGNCHCRSYHTMSQNTTGTGKCVLIF